MITKNRIINLLKIISKKELSFEEKSLFYREIHDAFFKKNEKVIVHYIYINKLQYLFIKHLIECNCTYGCLNKINIEILSERLFFLQYKYREYLDELSHITSKMEENAIHYAILKGMSIIDPLYINGKNIYRGFGDIDILVEKCNIPEVAKILNDMGYIQGRVNEKNQIEKAERKEIVYWSLNSHQEHKFIKESSFFDLSPRFILTIDVNTTIFEGGDRIDPLPTEELLRHRKLKTNSLCNYYVLEETYELLALCYHFYKDTKYVEKARRGDDYNIRKFSDIREYVLCYEKCIDWQHFFSMALKCDILDKVCLVLYLVVNFYQEEKLKILENEISLWYNQKPKVEWCDLLIKE